MRVFWLVSGVLVSFLWLPAGAQDARGALDAATTAMGAGALRAIEYGATSGNIFWMGQAGGPGRPWPRFTVTRHSVLINYNTQVMREETARVDDERPARGGGAGGYNPQTGQGGIRPIPFGPNLVTTTRDGQTEDGALQIWLTPHGFLKGAAANAATLTVAPRERDGSLALWFRAFDKYVVRGTLSRNNLVERVQTTIAHPLYGDVVFEAIYSGYRNVGGVQVPSRLVQRQMGFPILDVPLSQAQPDSAAALALAAPAPAGGRGQAAAGPAAGRGEGRGQGPAPGAPGLPTTELAPGFWAIGGGGAQSFVLDFRDFSVVVEAAGNPARVEGVIAQARQLTNSKPIRYVVNTHQHADHSGGLRAVVAEGLTILTHEGNLPFYRTMLRNPATLAPDRLAKSPRPPVLEGMGARKVITDGTRTIEVHLVRGQLHSEGMLMVYLPTERMVIQSDMYSPRPPDAKPLPWSAQTANFYENIERLKLDVAQMVHVHGGMDPLEKLVAAANLPH